MQIFLFILILTALYFCSCSLAEIYKWTDENGLTQFSNIKPKNTTVETVNVYSYQTAINTDEETSSHHSSTKIPSNYLTRSKKALIYSTQWCNYSKKTKKHFRENNIAYINYDIEISQSARKRYKKLRTTIIPIILVGKKRINGFSVDRFNSFYN